MSKDLDRIKAVFELYKALMLLLIIGGSIFSTFYITQNYYVAHAEVTMDEMKQRNEAHIMSLNFDKIQQQVLIDALNEEVDDLYGKLSDTTQDLVLERAIIQIKTQKEVSLIDARGLYSYPSEILKVYGKGLETDEVISVAFHEAGHHFWYTELNPTQREEYELIVNSSNKSVSEYAKKNIAEDFAETFQSFIFARCQLVGFDERQKFMEESGALSTIHYLFKDYCKI